MSLFQVIIILKNPIDQQVRVSQQQKKLLAEWSGRCCFGVPTTFKSKENRWGVYKAIHHQSLNIDHCEWCFVNVIVIEVAAKLLYPDLEGFLRKALCPFAKLCAGRHLNIAYLNNSFRYCCFWVYCLFISPQLYRWV